MGLEAAGAGKSVIRCEVRGADNRRLNDLQIEETSFDPEIAAETDFSQEVDPKTPKDIRTPHPAPSTRASAYPPPSRYYS